MADLQLLIDLAVPHAADGSMFERRFIVHVQQMAQVAAVTGVLVNGPLLAAEPMDADGRRRLCELAVAAAPTGFPVWVGIDIDAADDVRAAIESAHRQSVSGVVLMPTGSISLAALLAASEAHSLPSLVWLDSNALDSLDPCHVLAESISSVNLLVQTNTMDQYRHALNLVGESGTVLAYSTTGTDVTARLAAGGRGAVVAAANAAARDFGKALSSPERGDALPPAAAHVAAAVEVALQADVLHPARAVESVLVAMGIFPAPPTQSHDLHPRDTIETKEPVR